MDVFADDFWIRRGYEAMTFFGTIVANKSDVHRLDLGDGSLRRHETIHLRQAQSTHDSWLLFYLLYFWYYLRALPQNRRMRNAAYYINPFELEAYRHMDDADYLEGCGAEGATEWRTYARMSPRERLRKFYNK